MRGKLRSRDGEAGEADRPRPTLKARNRQRAGRKQAGGGVQGSACSADTVLSRSCPAQAQRGSAHTQEGRPRNEGREQGRAEKRENQAGEGGIAGMGTG